MRCQQRKCGINGFGHTLFSSYGLIEDMLYIRPVGVSYGKKDQHRVPHITSMIPTRDLQCPSVKADQADINVNCLWWLIGGLCFAATLLTSLNLENSCNRTGSIILLQPSMKAATLESYFNI